MKNQLPPMLLTIVLAAACRTTAPTEAEVKVVGGNDASETEATAVVRLLPFGPQKTNNCGGTFVKASWAPQYDILITAAHCLTPDGQTNYAKLVAVHPFDATQQAKPIKKFFHPEFTGSEVFEDGRYDMGALVFPAGTAAALGVKKKMTFSSEEPAPGDKIYVVSFGPPDYTNCGAGHGVKRIGSAIVGDVQDGRILWDAEPPFGPKNAATAPCDSGGALLRGDDQTFTGLVIQGEMVDGVAKQYHLALNTEEFEWFWNELRTELTQ